MNGAESGKPSSRSRESRSAPVRLFQIDPSWYDRHWWDDPARSRRSAFGCFRRIVSACSKWWDRCREALF